jgi:hypothetical protein
MHDNGRGCIVQGYNAQLVVDAEAQVIVAAEVTQQVIVRGSSIRRNQHLGTSADRLFHAFPLSSGLWRMPLAAGGETQVLGGVRGTGFAILNEGIYFVRPSEGGRSPTLRFLTFSMGTVKDIASIPHEINQGLSVSPDGRYVLYTQEDQLPGSDLMLVQNFR